MKKGLLLLTILLWPHIALAYSNFIIPGGQSIGVDTKMQGIMIIGFYKINGSYNKENLEIGDYIIKINDEDIQSIDDLTKILEKEKDLKPLKITYIRDNKEYTTDFNVIKEDGKYKTGLYVKDGIKGIGTLSYIDPETNVFGALGHEIIESNTSLKVEIDGGYLLPSYITGIEKSSPGTAGSKIATFDYEHTLGDINKNTEYGIFGTYYSPLGSVMEVGNPVLGDAYIKTVLKGDLVENYPIKITKINETSKTKNITFKIKSDSLKEKTGGVIQGMSGSPIIQNDKIVGVLTHVIVDNPTSGYGIFITTMLEEGDKEVLR